MEKNGIEEQLIKMLNQDLELEHAAELSVLLG